MVKVLLAFLVGTLKLLWLFDYLRYEKAVFDSFDLIDYMFFWDSANYSFLISIVILLLTDFEWVFFHFKWSFDP